MLKNHPRSRALLLLGAAVLLCAWSDKQGWKEYTSDSGRYSAVFPGAPTTKSQSVETAAGPVSMHITMVEGRDWAYSVIHTDMPAVVEQAPPKSVLEGAKQGLTGKGFKITKSKDMTLFGKPALELFGQDKEGRHLRVRIFLVKNRMYQIMAAGTSEAALTDADAEKFVTSVKLK